VPEKTSKVDHAVTIEFDAFRDEQNLLIVIRTETMGRF
jgi:hypothetical protein